ncbi:MAG: hypothetical protein WC924_01860 [Candidatus Gracilibacteria bacterium]
MLIISLGAFLILGFLSSNFILKNMDTSVTEEPLTTVSFQTQSIARDINFYTEDAPAIVIGQVTKVGEPYLENQGFGSIQEIELAVTEVLKGNRSMTNVTIIVRGHEIVQVDGTGKSIIPGNEPPLFIEGEHVLVFLGMNGQGEYVSFAGPYGKYLIDDELNVTSIGDFTMPLKELKAKIDAALQNSTNS